MGRTNRTVHLFLKGENVIEGCVIRGRMCTVSYNKTKNTRQQNNSGPLYVAQEYSANSDDNIYDQCIVYLPPFFSFFFLSNQLFVGLFWQWAWLSDTLYFPFKL